MTKLEALEDIVISGGLTGKACKALEIDGVQWAMVQLLPDNMAQELQDEWVDWAIEQLCGDER